MMSGCPVQGDAMMLDGRATRADGAMLGDAGTLGTALPSCLASVWLQGSSVGRLPSLSVL